jgi:hypothetical protein
VAKTVPLRKNPQVRFSQDSSPLTPGAERIYEVLIARVDVSICRNFLRIDNNGSIAEGRNWLNR